MTLPLDEVQTLVRQVAADVVNPRFRALPDAEVSEKSPGELVSSVDREAEQALTEGLRALVPGALVVGEEAVAGEPGLLRALGGERPVVLVDPLDGTRNYVEGSPDHAVMVALVDRGRTVASVVYQPQHDRMYVAERGSGAYADGVRLRRDPPAVEPQLRELRGVVLRRYLDEPTRRAVDANAHRFAGLTTGSSCAGVEYPLVATGGRDFLLFWRTLPWDHASGALLVTEAGGAVRRLDGTDYRPASNGKGLLVTGAERMHAAVLSGLGVRAGA